MNTNEPIRIDEYLWSSDENLRALADAFCAIFPQDIRNSFGHNVFSDGNWDDGDFSIDHIDDAFESVAERHGYVTAKAMRDAAYHMLHIFKIIDEYEAAMMAAVVAKEFLLNDE